MVIISKNNRSSRSTLTVSLLGLLAIAVVLVSLYSFRLQHRLVELEARLLQVGNPPACPTTGGLVPAPSAQQQDGWHSIDVFYGGRELLDRQTQHGRKYYSQAAQDKIVVHLTKGKRNGYFVDLASNHAYNKSNTFALERGYGWNGLCIEANPTYWRDLSFRDCQVVGAVVGKTRKEQVTFRLQAEYGSIVGFDRKKAGEFAMTSYTVPLQDILERYNAPKVIDYLSLDVEGAEEYIMSAFPMDKYRVNIMTVERPSDKLKEIMERNGYQQLKELAAFGETLWAHASVVNALDQTALEKPHTGQGPPGGYPYQFDFDSPLLRETTSATN